VKISESIPESTIRTINDYLEHGYETGDFVRAVLENNLKLAFGYADRWNKAALEEIVKYCYNCIPHSCWGSKEIVNDWIASKKNKIA
jgi:hypothetical protein